MSCPHAAICMWEHHRLTPDEERRIRIEERSRSQRQIEQLEARNDTLQAEVRRLRAQQRAAA